jgi:putative adhesin
VHTFETAGRVLVRVGIQGGQVDLETWDAARTEVDVTPLRDDDATMAAVHETQVVSRERPDGVTEIAVEQPKRRGGFLSRGPKLGVKVRCPHGTDLELTTSSADVRGAGGFGDVTHKTASGDTALEAVAGARISSASGDIAIGTGEGALMLNTASGDIEVRLAAGPLTANLVSGDARVLEARDALSVNTVSGDQQIDASGGAPVRLQSVSGDVRIDVRPGLRLWIDAASVSGTVSSQLDASDAPPEGAESVGELRIRTVSGDIGIGRALPLSVS